MYEPEFNKITEKILNNRKFKKMKNVPHHYATTRYAHNVEVAYKTFKIAKRLNLNYVDMTKAALMHDFYFDEDFSSRRKCFFNHAKISLKNANKITKLNEIQENIIMSHMFPIGGKRPRYKESIIVDFVDDIVSIKEISIGNLKYLNAAFLFMFIYIFNYLK